MAARDRDLADRGGHIVDRDGEEALGDRLDRHRLPPSCVGNFGQAAPATPPSRAAGRRSAPNTAGKCAAIDPAEHEVAVGHRQRPAVAVAGRSRLRARRIRARRGSACRRTGRSIRRPPRRCGSASSARGCARRRPGSRRPARTARHNATRRSRCRPCRSRSARLRRPCARARRDHADHPARRARQDRVLAAKRRGVGQPAVRLHEVQRRVAASPAATRST